MSIKALFWNIENFKGDDPVRARKVADHILLADADIVGFSEIKDKAALRSILQEHLSSYDFSVTDGREGIELLAGCKRGVFQQALFTQRREFKADNPHLRPGSLLSVKKNSIFFNFLFLHTDSGKDDRDFSNRQEMFKKIWSMRQRLNAIEGRATRFMVLGDLNTMGRDAGNGKPAISAEREIEDLAQDAGDEGMALLRKSHPNTWARVRNDGQISLASDLDHVLATETIRLNDQGGGVTVRVRGWVDAANDAERRDFVEKISDHCSVECEIDDTAL